MEIGNMTRAERKRFRLWVARLLIVETALVVAFIGCCGAMLAHKDPEPVEPLVLIKEVPVEVTVAPEESGRCGPSEEAVALAKTVWGEARGCSTTEQAAVVWCILNRVDSDSPDFRSDIISVITQKGQFDGWDSSYPVEDDILALCEDVLARWELEKMGVGSAGRVLPKEYVFFEGDGTHNHFRRQYEHTGETWSWSLPSPYEK